MSLSWQLVRGDSWSSGEIAYFGGGDFSHIDFIDTDGSCIGARSDKIGIIQPGVQRRPASYEKWKLRVVFTLTTATLAQESAFRSFIYAQLGKPYDKLAIWGFILGRSWEETDRWICSELQCAALEAAGIVGKLYLSANRITPNDMSLILSCIGATSVRG